MHIVHIASELAPVAKVGGLGDVLLGLPRELSWKGHDVDIILPKYDCMNGSAIRDMSVYQTDVMSYFDGNWYPNTIWIGWIDNLKVYFIEPHHPKYFFNRGCFYGCEDDVDRYLYFCRAALEFMFKANIRPQIIHAHDWQTAVIPVLYRDMYIPLGLNSAKTVFTIHNIEYQGKCSKTNLDDIGLPGINYLVPNKLQDSQNDQLINLLQGGIIYSDFFTTVSPTYAKEVQTPEGGRGLDKVITQYLNKFAGVLNGLDYSYWNPEIDPHLPAHYSSREKPLDRHDTKTLDKKAYIKNYLRDKFILAEIHRPIIGCVARIVPQKGPELIKNALEFALKHNAQFVLLGACQDDELGKEFHILKQQYIDHPHVSMTLHLQEDLSHLIFAASDIFIVPSLFEPCGLTQMISLKYGAIPVVRRTGGLADTIFDVDHDENDGPIPPNGYTFDDPTKEGLESALKRAVDTWFHDPEKWRKMMVTGMNIDFSWNIPASQYVEIYKAVQTHSN